MKIIVVSNFYPPQHIGGYELGCRDVVENLRARGHELQVLTSTFESPKNSGKKFPFEPHVERILRFSTNSGAVPEKKFAECRKLLRVAKKFSPDVVYFWNQAQLSLWLPMAMRWHGRPVAFFISDTNFISRRVGAWLEKFSCGTGIFSRLINSIFGQTFLARGWPVMQNQLCHFASEFLEEFAKKNGVRTAPNSIVTRWGINLLEFLDTPRGRWPLRRLLYVGQIIPQKGIETALAALGLLAKEKKFSELSLTVVGGGLFVDYKKKIRNLPEQLGIANRVNFLGQIPRADLPRIYAEHDALIFPSEWEEPFAITPLEAMASGLAVIGTTTGGSGELFRDRQTALTFRAGDAEDCARAIRELAQDRELFETISRRGQAEVRKNHSLDIMVAAIEKSLQTILSDSQK